jgi:hypothetical protein
MPSCDCHPNSNGEFGMNFRRSVIGHRFPCSVLCDPLSRRGHFHLSSLKKLLNLGFGANKLVFNMLAASFLLI